MSVNSPEHPLQCSVSTTVQVTNSNSATRSFLAVARSFVSEDTHQTALVYVNIFPLYAIRSSTAFSMLLPPPLSSSIILVVCWIFTVEAVPNSQPTHWPNSSSAPQHLHTAPDNGRLTGTNCPFMLTPCQTIAGPLRQHTMQLSDHPHPLTTG